MLLSKKLLSIDKQGSLDVYFIMAIAAVIIAGSFVIWRINGANEATIANNTLQLNASEKRETSKAEKALENKQPVEAKYEEELKTLQGWEEFRSKHGFKVNYPDEWTLFSSLEDYDQIADAEAVHGNHFSMQFYDANSEIPFAGGSLKLEPWVESRNGRSFKQIKADGVSSLSGSPELSDLITEDISIGLNEAVHFRFKDLSFGDGEVVAVATQNLVFFVSIFAGDTTTRHDEANLILASIQEF